MTLHHVYMDESGTHAGSPVLTMAGYVFASDQARKFSRDWERELQRFGLPFAHMTDCANGQGDYKGMLIEQRVEVEKSLIRLIKLRTVFGFAVSVEADRYSDGVLTSPFNLGAYTFCLANCVILVDEWAKENCPDARFSYFLESGHDDQSEAHNIMSQLNIDPRGERYLAHTFVNKRAAPPLQAADMLAWQEGHYLIRRLKGHDTPRKDYAALKRGKDRTILAPSDTVDDWFRLSRWEDELMVEFISTWAPKDVGETAGRVIKSGPNKEGRALMDVPKDVMERWRAFKASKGFPV